MCTAKSTARGFLEGAKKFAVGGMTATAIWESLRPNYAWAQQVPKDDKRIKTEYVTVPSPQGNGNIKGYLVRPAKATGKLPGVLVVHENRGLNPYIEDVARRLGTENFMAFAPDGLTSVGGYPGDDEKGGAAVRQGGPAQDDRGFRGGGAMAEGAPGLHGQDRRGGLLLRRRDREHAGGADGRRDLAAAVPFYGGQPPAADVAKIKAAMLVHHGSQDTRLAGGWPAYEEALKANHVTLRGVRVRRRAARLPQRHDAAIRRGGREAGLGAHAGAVQQVFARLNAVSTTEP